MVLRNYPGENMIQTNLKINSNMFNWEFRAKLL